MNDDHAARLLDVARAAPRRWEPWTPRPRRFANTGDPRLDRLVSRCDRGVDYLPLTAAGLVVVLDAPAPVLAAMAIAVPIHFGYFAACGALVRAATRRYARCSEHPRDVCDNTTQRARPYVVCRAPWSPKTGSAPGPGGT